jgi:hypothetical protein
VAATNQAIGVLKRICSHTGETALPGRLDSDSHSPFGCHLFQRFLGSLVHIVRRVFVRDLQIVEECKVVITKFAEFIDATRTNERAGIGYAGLEYHLFHDIRGGVTATCQSLHREDALARRHGVSQSKHVWSYLLNQGGRSGREIPCLNYWRARARHTAWWNRDGG